MGKRNRHLGIVTVGRGRAGVQLGAASGFPLAPVVGVVKVAAVIDNFDADGESTRRRTQRSFPRHSTKRAFGVVSPLKAVSYSWSGRTLEIARVESSLLLIRFWVSPSSRSNVSGCYALRVAVQLGARARVVAGRPGARYQKQDQYGTQQREPRSLAVRHTPAFVLQQRRCAYCETFFS